MSLHLETLSSFRANQFMFLLLNAVCLAEKQLIPILTGAKTHDLPHS